MITAKLSIFTNFSRF
ncbi:uncharacterized protein CELE_F48F5.8 [Caenorhabditis elegans]|uniref:Uncharacterized protein n=1 Tax=Caenorhabditis elegans TaxID=6239 RepID=A0A2K5ATX2_CAEEL|nr:Uncharacterized protein CELE_F48F5.8 [Caenorhabditis elegans]SPC47960.1 Uncharacterized protein CELE_F48F5.8 [Caenorhabditis elegans]|eukprot:NP_001348771.1 Uncharacterized protein CELE_F48F5.8 [Caenorhabditis elegans]